MSYNFAAPLGETKFKGDLNAALAYLDSHPVTDTVVDASNVKLGSLAEVLLPDGETNTITRSSFVQLIHFLGIQWESVKALEPTAVLNDVSNRLKGHSGQFMLRIKDGVIQAVLSPGYTPIDNADVLRSAIRSLDLSNTLVTFFRGNMRITGTSDGVSLQPAVGDIVSGGLELVNNELGKGVLSVNSFLLRLVCTNGAVVPSQAQEAKFVHRGWEREGLIRHIGEAGSEAVSRVKGLDDALKRMVETRLGDREHSRLLRTVAEPLGKRGLEEFRTAMSPDSTLYDAYNHLTAVSQRRSLGPRRELEVIAGTLLHV